MAETGEQKPFWKARLLAADRDMHSWLDLIHAVEMDGAGRIETSEEHLRHALNYPNMTRWVVEAPGGSGVLIGYALLYAQIPERSQLSIMVHPAWRCKGVGRALLELLVDQARKNGAAWANYEIDEREAAGRALLEKYGFAAHSHAWRLRAPAGVQFPAPQWPLGFCARSYAEVNDLNVFAQVCNRSYRDMWGHHENTAGGLPAQHFNRTLAIFDHQGLLIAFAPDGTPVGVTRGMPGEAEDTLDNPAVAPEYRHLKLQLPLALTLLQWLRGQGDHPVLLESWGDTPETIALFQDIGFELVEHDIAYRKALLPTH